MSGTRAVYPGSFDPITNGHLDIIQRGLAVFDHVVIAVAYNRDKQSGLFTPEERVEMIREAIGKEPRVEVAAFEGLLVEYAKKRGAGIILRGLRAVSDFEFEFQMAMMNDQLAPEVTTMFMAPSPQYSFLSSSLVKEIARYGGDISHFVPRHVEKAVRSKLKKAH